MQSTTQQQGGQLKRTMKTRHLIMLSLGGVIGTGLFFNTGYIISTTGAAGTLLAYLIGALVLVAQGTPQEVIQQPVIHRWYGADVRLVQHPDNAVPQVYLAP